MANNSDFYVFGSLACLKVEFADEVNLAGGEDHDENLPLVGDMGGRQGAKANWMWSKSGCTSQAFCFAVGSRVYQREDSLLE